MRYGTTINRDCVNTVTIMIDEIEENSVVLEFGPASGRLTKFLSEEKGCTMYIVELDEEAGKIAAQYAKDSVIGDIEQYEWCDKFKNEKFDYILFADVLEHLRNPEAVMQRAKDFLKKSGRVITSLPNIAHNSVLIDLYNNKFEYRQTGLLDSTHLRFWTKKSIDNFFEQLKMYPIKKYATQTMVGSNEFDNSYKSVPYAFSALLKGRSRSIAYQYVYVAALENTGECEDYIKYVGEEYFTDAFFFDEKNEMIGERYTEYIGNDDDKLDIVIDVPKMAKKLRLDPLNAPCSVRLIGINGIDENENIVKLIFDSSNANITANQKFTFYHNDSQIFYCLPDNVRKIKISIEFVNKTDYLAISDMLSKNITDFYQALRVERDEKERIIIENKDSIIKEKDAAIKEKDAVIKEREDIIIQKENYICEQREKLDFAYGFLDKKIIRFLFRKYNERHGKDLK